MAGYNGLGPYIASLVSVGLFSLDKLAVPLKPDLRSTTDISGCTMKKLAITEHSINLGHQVPNHPYFSPEYGDNMFHQNVGLKPKDYTAQ